MGERGRGVPINADADIGFAEHTDSDSTLEERAGECARQAACGVTPKTNADTDTNTEHGSTDD